jgi:hypothetical protein
MRVHRGKKVQISVDFGAWRHCMTHVPADDSVGNFLCVSAKLCPTVPMLKPLFNDGESNHVHLLASEAV